MKEENEDAKKEAEMALLALNCIRNKYKVPEELYLDEIKEIIQHHQKRHNLTHLSYQSAWDFLINRFHTNIFLEDTIVNDLHFVREAAREIEELSKCVDWKKRKEGEEKKEKKTKEEIVLVRWVRTLETFSRLCKLRNEELAVIIGIIVQLFRAAKFFSEDMIRVIILS
ncbi:uncharacterized protein MONOS_7029 [Monocercomonoides exilis]|uniref:uncharacterized protein n=1 Tax=Monocercomonoides exilis TaxID=2049356 RepID=UPI00355A5E7B|nr:hypothetical protein MONOS_7029 [Monocercomonoides exilis]|eukprot:MONOS_7029.1-p1 / transcript=MONOS_7029.1 / gene=MONOS_7029 / organism=Monocercomonoides_exilis_PA203 / gene_product=unspecified product / transcript_product=unspecified product / location=Mono_scaffold00231:84239-84806(-) / protein_length=169 / sequence_SO=supercontig / SO=protein_coding / is_pseudo=false